VSKESIGFIISEFWMGGSQKAQFVEEEEEKQVTCIGGINSC
jgi:hypothetical protein